MLLPDFPDISTEMLYAIAERFHLHVGTISRMPEIGIFNAVYLLDNDLILRIPRNHPRFVEAVMKEATVAPLVYATGIHTPRLIAFDDSRELLPVPYVIYERVHGATLEVIQPDPTQALVAYYEVGRELAILHEHVTPDGPIGTVGRPFLPHDDPRPLPEQLANQGYFSIVEARWLTRWIEHVQSVVQTSVPQRFLHGDTQATNIVVDPDTLNYRALIDWGSCGWGDPALDFAGMPLRAVPTVLAGYREITTLPDDETAEARVLLTHLHIALLNLGNGPQPLRSWAERPMSYLFDIMRFLLEEPSERWRKLLPV